MEAQTKKIIFWTAMAGVALVGIYWVTQAAKSDAQKKSEKATFLVANGFNNNLNFVLGATDEYVDAWYKAAKAKKPTFTVGTKTYTTVGGKSVTSI